LTSREAQLEELKAVPGVGGVGANKLLSEGYTLLRLSHANPEDIARILGISNKAAKEIVAAALQEIIGKTGELPRPMNLAEYKKWMDNRIVWFTTGSKRIDEMIGGGLRSSSISGLSGPFATGKTQCVLTTITDCICNHGKYAVFIETELDTLDPLRPEEIAKARGWIDKWDPTKFIVIDSTKIRDVSTQFYYYEVIYDMAKENGYDIGVIGIDSFNSTFMRKFKGRELFPSRKQEFGRHFTTLEDIAKELNCHIMLTFQVMEVPVAPTESKGGMDAAKVRSFFGTPYMPWGGHGATHPPATWISLEKTSSKTIWKAHLFDSSRTKRGETFFQITEAGVCDLPDALAKKLKLTS